MTFNRNYAAVPQIPTAPGFQPIPINQKAINAAVLPFQQTINLAAETVILNPAVSTLAQPVPLVLAIPSKSIIEGQPFELLASGDVFVGAATPTVVLKLYSGTSMTLANNLLLATTPAETATPAAPWFFRATLIGSSATGRIVGTYKANFGGVLVAEGALAAPITGVNFLTDPVANFMLTATPNNSNGQSYIRLYEYALNFG